MAGEQFQGKDTVGNNDPTVSNHLKTWIMQEDKVVCGITGEGTNKDIVANWDSPFEGEDVGSRFKVTSGLVQSVTDKTSVTTLNTRQVWNGNRPTTFSLNLRLYALSDPKKEVMDALQYLEEMASPQLNGWSPYSISKGKNGYEGNIGRIPGLVTICIGRKAIYTDCVIESISQPLDREVTSDGLLVRADIQLQIATIQVPNKTDVPKFYRG